MCSSHKGAVFDNIFLCIVYISLNWIPAMTILPLHLLHQYMDTHSHPVHVHPADGGSTHFWNTSNTAHIDMVHRLRDRVGINNWTVSNRMLDICLVITIYWQHWLAVTEVHWRWVQRSNQKTLLVVLLIITATSTSKPTTYCIIAKSREQMGIGMKEWIFINYKRIWKETDLSDF
jgi:hypothetical protein